jgi:hypothetical protein
MLSNAEVSKSPIIVLKKVVPGSEQSQAVIQHTVQFGGGRRPTALSHYTKE